MKQWKTLKTTPNFIQANFDQAWCKLVQKAFPKASFKAFLKFLTTLPQTSSKFTNSHQFSLATPPHLFSSFSSNSTLLPLSSRFHRFSSCWFTTNSLRTSFFKVFSSFFYLSWKGKEMEKGICGSKFSILYLLCFIPRFMLFMLLREGFLSIQRIFSLFEVFEILSSSQWDQ
jgi:hypothetical protein